MSLICYWPVSFAVELEKAKMGARILETATTTREHKKEEDEEKEDDNTDGRLNTAWFHAGKP